VRAVEGGAGIAGTVDAADDVAAGGLDGQDALAGGGPDMPAVVGYAVDAG